MDRAIVTPPTQNAMPPAAVLVSLASAAILGALAFEHLGGYAPCPLCLEQRTAYYAGIPAALLGIALIAADRRGLAMLVFAMVGLAFLANAGLGVYHAGAEWKFWPGPDTCGGSGGISGGAGGLLDSLSQEAVVRCDEAALRIFGVSLAGWNAVICAALAILSAVVVRRLK